MYLQNVVQRRHFHHLLHSENKEDNTLFIKLLYYIIYYIAIVQLFNYHYLFNNHYLLL
jgi:hypothetical protein